MARISAWMGVAVAAAIVGSLVLRGDFSQFGAVGPVAAAALLCLGAPAAR